MLFSAHLAELAAKLATWSQNKPTCPLKDNRSAVALKQIARFAITVVIAEVDWVP